MSGRFIPLVQSGCLSLMHGMKSLAGKRKVYLTHRVASNLFSAVQMLFLSFEASVDSRKGGEAPVMAGNVLRGSIRP
jgi:hypothetical protein